MSIAVPPIRDLIFVGLQGVLFVALAFDFDLGWRPLRGLPVIGGVLCAASIGSGLLAVLQLGTGLTPWPSPRAGASLVTTGAYRYARHPIYAALLAFGVGVAVLTASPWRLLVTAGLYLLFWRKATYEERLLRERYPGYAAYAARTPRFGW